MSQEITLEVDDGEHTFDVRLTLEETTDVAELITLVQRVAGISRPTSGLLVTRSQRLADRHESVASLQLRSGDRIELRNANTHAQVQPAVQAQYPYQSQSPSDSGQSSGQAERVLVEQIRPLSGTSTVHVLGDRATIGRDAANDIVLEEASVSRQHAQIDRRSGSFGPLGDGRNGAERAPRIGTDATATVTDLKSANGVAVNGFPIAAETAHPLSARSVVTVGDLVLAVYDPDHIPPHIQVVGNELAFNRPPRVATNEPPLSFALPRAPAAPTRRTIPVITIVFPMIFGVIMGILLSPLYLLLGLASPLMAIGSVFEDRRTGRKSAIDEQARWRTTCASMMTSANAAHLQWQEIRRRRHPSAEELSARCIVLSESVWETRPWQNDFMQTRAGISNLPSFLNVSLPEQGDETLRAEMEAKAEQLRLDADVPVVLDWAVRGTIGIVGSPTDRHLVANAQLVQIAARHSPNDVNIVIISPQFLPEWDWCKWLPHAVVDGTVAVAADDGEADVLFHAILELAESRDEARTGSLASAKALPHVVVLIEPPVSLSPREANQLCSLASATSITVLWLASDAGQLPGACGAIVQGAGRDSRGRLLTTVTFPDAGTRHERVRTDLMTEQQARRAARTVAPLRDTTTGGGAGGVPNRVNLIDCLPLLASEARAAEEFGTPELAADPTTAQDPLNIRAFDPNHIAARWAEPPSGLQAPIGRGVRGLATIDMRADGPHALVAGTTGAGKSELLQTWVAALAMAYPPTRITFVLIDYKGGAAFKDCVALPHTVGFVTDLDPRNGERAMTSLEAELVRREHLLAKYGAKDLFDLEKSNIAIAPPSLVIIVDEFAALKAEMPDFVTGLVDIAQRGRSLGVHLVLATQKPGGVIDPKIQANTNLRIALRMASSSESDDVLGRPVAASISRRIPGRCFVRIGETQLFEVQAGYVGAVQPTSVVKVIKPPRLFALGKAGRMASVQNNDEEDSGAPTDLQQLVAACANAAKTLGLPPPFRPWLDLLPTAMRVDDVPQPANFDAHSGLRAVVGLSDEPSAQRQLPFVVDLETDGNIAIYGGPGTGKTTFLRTLSVQLARGRSPERLHIYGLDFGSRGLLALERLPHCGGVVTGDQLDRVRRLIDMLSTSVTQRQELLARVGAGNLAELEQATGEIVPAIVVLIDGFSAFWQVVEPLDRSEHITRLLRVASDGRSVGIHLVYTADRRAAVVPALSGVTGGRLVMNMPSPDEYSSLGYSQLARTNAVLPRGRVVVNESMDAQIGVVSRTTTDGVAQQEAISDIGVALKQKWPDQFAHPVEDLPTHITLASLLEMQSAQGLSFMPGQGVLGLDDGSRRPIVYDFNSNPLFLVVGPEQSGRSTALDTLASSMMHTTPNLHVHFVSSRRNALAESSKWTRSITGADQVLDYIAEMRTTVEARVKDASLAEEPILIVLDDADDLIEGNSPPALEIITKFARDANVFVIAGLSTFRSIRAFTLWVQLMRTSRNGIVLTPAEEDGDVFNVRLPNRTGLFLPPGRGYFVSRAGLRLVQVAVTAEK
jgi:DNA segregation ATPase FtsK/SpoIIIE, S-DNA-T family